MRQSVAEAKEPWQDLLDRARRALAKGKEIEGGIDPEMALNSPHQPRRFFGSESLGRLGNSMKTMGQIYPGIVRRIKSRPEKPFEILDGERRWRSAKLVKMKYRAVVVEIDDEASAFLVAAIANLNREGHTAIEMSDSINGMLRIGIPMSEVSSLLGISVMWADQLYGLQKLHPKVRAMLDPALPKRQQLPVTAAIQISKADQLIQVGLALKTLEKKITIRGLRGEVVRASKRAGLHIRVRKVEPNKQWRSVRAVSEQVLRISKDLLGQFSEETSGELVLSRSREDVEKIATNLRSAAEHLLSSADLMEQRRKKKS